MAKKSNVVKELRDFGNVSTAPRHFDHVRGYDKLQGDLLRHLKRANRKSFVLVGDSGVGKSSVLEALFRDLVRKKNGDWIILETSTAQMLSGTRYIGEWETRLTNLAELATVDKKVIIYFTDVQNLHGAGRSANDNGNMADALSPYLERGEVIVVGECTSEAFRKGVESVPSIHKHVTAFNLHPTSGDETNLLARYAFDDLNKAFEEETGSVLLLPDVTLSSIEQYSGIYFPGTAQPGAAIQLLQQIVEKRRDEFDEAQSQPKSRAKVSISSLSLGQKDIITALHRLSGLPLDLLDDSVPLSLKAVREYFDARVIGQDEAVSKVIDVVTMIKAGLADPGKPVSVMLFAGPTGVGKTELAKALAEFLFGSPDRMIRCDMSEYKDFNAFEKLIGRPGANGKDDAAPSLATRVRQKPFSVVLLDEVEKAHTNVFDVLLQAFDDGRLSDSGGNTTNLTQTIIILTSNLGSDMATPQPLGFDRKGFDRGEAVQKALRGFFRPEFLNRLDHVVRFRSLERDHMRTLARRELGRALLRGGLIRRELRVDVDPSVIDLLVKHGYSELYGARPLRRAVEEHAVLPVARRIVGLGDKGRGSLLRLVVKNGHVSVVAVEDRQTRVAERITRGIEVVDPVGGTKKRVSAAEVKRELEDLAVLLFKLQEKCEISQLDQRKTELLERSVAIDFWDDTKAARETLGEIYRIERLSEAVMKTLQRHDRLAQKFEAVRKAGDVDALRQLILDLHAVEHFAELVRYGLECGDREDRRDAFVVVRLVDDSAESDLVAKLAGSYVQWAQRKGYGVRVVHEEVVSGSAKLTREAVIEITGPAVYGVLRAEQGQHEFVFGKTARLARRNRFVSVRVLGTPAAELEVVNMQVRAKAARGKALVADRIRARVSAIDRVSGKSVAIVSPLPADQAEEAAEDLLAAEIERSFANGADAGQVVRKYQMTPSASIKDVRAPKVAVNARDFWRGEIDELLRAGIKDRLAG